MRTSAFQRRASVTSPTGRTSRRSSSNFRNPPEFWRRVIVGLAYAIPGALAGELLGVLFPRGWIFGAMFLGLAIGFIGGFYLEGK